MILARRAFFGTLLVVWVVVVLGVVTNLGSIAGFLQSFVR